MGNNNADNRQRTAAQAIGNDIFGIIHIPCGLHHEFSRLHTDCGICLESTAHRGDTYTESLGNVFQFGRSSFVFHYLRQYLSYSFRSSILSPSVGVISSSKSEIPLLISMLYHWISFFISLLCTRSRSKSGSIFAKYSRSSSPLAFL